MELKELVKILKQQHDNFRKNPQGLIPLLKQRLNNFTDRLYHYSQDFIIQTHEGRHAVEDLIQQLKLLDEPLPPLQWSFELHLAADEQAISLSRQTESKSLQPLNVRVEKYTQWYGPLAENVEFGFNDIQEVLINLLIDDGLRSRGHRNNILNDEFNYLGIGVNQLKDFGFVAVFIYASLLEPLEHLKAQVEPPQGCECPTM